MSIRWRIVGCGDVYGGQKRSGPAERPRQRGARRHAANAGTRRGLRKAAQHSAVVLRRRSTDLRLDDSVEEWFRSYYEARKFKPLSQTEWMKIIRDINKNIHPIF